MAGATTWTLSPGQLDHVWERLGLDVVPFPFELARHGATDLERARLGSAVLDELRAAGHLDGSLRLLPDLEAALRLLANPESGLDSAWVGGEDSAAHRVLAALSGRRAVLGVQEPTLGALTVRDIGPGTLVDSVLDLLPRAPAGRSPGGAWPLAAAPHDPDASALLGVPHHASGQLGSTLRDATGIRHRSAVVRWFDIAGDGRYLAVRYLSQDGTPWLEVRPATGSALATRVRRLLAATQ